MKQPAQCHITDSSWLHVTEASIKLTSQPLLEAFSSEAWWDAEVLEKKNESYVVRYKGYGNEIEEKPPNLIRLRSRKAHDSDCPFLQPNVHVAVYCIHPRAHEPRSGLNLLSAWYDGKIISKVQRAHYYRCTCKYSIQLIKVISNLRHVKEEKTIHVGIGKISILQTPVEGKVVAVVEQALTLSKSSPTKKWSCDIFPLHLSDTSGEKNASSTREDSFNEKLPICAAVKSIGCLKHQGKKSVSIEPVADTGNEVSTQECGPQDSPWVLAFNCNPKESEAVSQTIVEDLEITDDNESSSSYNFSSNEEKGPSDCIWNTSRAYVGSHYTLNESKGKPYEAHACSKETHHGNECKPSEEHVFSTRGIKSKSECKPFEVQTGAQVTKKESATKHKEECSQELKNGSKCKLKELPFGSPEKTSDFEITDDHESSSSFCSSFGKKDKVGSDKTESEKESFSRSNDTESSSSSSIILWPVDTEDHVAHLHKDKCAGSSKETHNGAKPMSKCAGTRGEMGREKLNTVAHKESPRTHANTRFAAAFKQHATSNGQRPSLIKKAERDAIKSPMLQKIEKDASFKTTRPSLMKANNCCTGLLKYFETPNLEKLYKDIIADMREKGKTDWQKLRKECGEDIQHEWNPLIFDHKSVPDELSEEDTDPLKHLWADCDAASQINQQKGFKIFGKEELMSSCEHSFMLDEDEGYVCKFCRFIGASIEEVFWPFVSSKFYKHKSYGDATSDKEREDDVDNKLDDTEPFLTMYGKPITRNIEKSNVSVWNLIPDLKGLMRRHQIEGFEFLWRNIGGGLGPEGKQKEPPGGCIIAHAPGTGKSFLIICFLKSFMLLNPWCRPLIVTPKSMLQTWQREFDKWGVGISSHILHSPQARYPASISCYLKKLSEWQKEQSVLLVTYQLFSSLTDEENTRRSSGYRRVGKLLMYIPGILILDEGHIPRNDSSKIRKALLHVHTKLRILVSGTLFQNNVQELFNSLYLVRPRFSDSLEGPPCKRYIFSDATLSLFNDYK